jgi:hypothetical protein
VHRSINKPVILDALHATDEGELALVTLLAEWFAADVTPVLLECFFTTALVHGTEVWLAVCVSVHGEVNWETVKKWKLLQSIRDHNAFICSNHSDKGFFLRWNVCCGGFRRCC